MTSFVVISPKQHMLRTTGQRKEISKVPDKVNALPEPSDIAEDADHDKGAHRRHHLVGGETGHKETDSRIGTKQQVKSKRCGGHHAIVGRYDLKCTRHKEDRDDTHQHQAIDHHGQVFSKNDSRAPLPGDEYNSFMVPPLISLLMRPMVSKGIYRYSFSITLLNNPSLAPKILSVSCVIYSSPMPPSSCDLALELS